MHNIHNTTHKTFTFQHCALICILRYHYYVYDNAYFVFRALCIDFVIFGFMKTRALPSSLGRSFDNVFIHCQNWPTKKIHYKIIFFRVKFMMHNLKLYLPLFTISVQSKSGPHICPAELRAVRIYQNNLSACLAEFSSLGGFTGLSVTSIVMIH